MTIEDALYHAVHDHPGGAPSLAPRMGIAASTLQCMANPNTESHGWPLKRAMQVIAMTNDMRPLEALCEEFGDGKLLKRVTRLAREFGDVPRKLQEILADGRVTSRELEALKREIYELQQAGAALSRLVERICTERATVPESERPE